MSSEQGTLGRILPHRNLHPILGLGLFLAVTTPAAGREVAWELFDRSQPCALPVRPVEPLPCGRFGTLFVQYGESVGWPPLPPGPGSCPRLDSGVEVPRRYSSRRAHGPQPDPRDADAPCSGGSCLTPLEGLDPEEPWVAVVDWNNWHGWSMSWTIRQSLAPRALPIVLFPLGDNGGPTPDSEASTTDDLSVLAQLCALTEAVDSGFVRRPSVINMSFGRGIQSETSAGGLEGVLSGLLDFLGRTSDGDDQGAIVAAAGNHRQLLFPASHPKVLATGAADLAALLRTGQYLPSWETPRPGGPVSLFPAGGLCLQYGDPEGGPKAQLMAPGSSFAAALFSGMLAGLLLDSGGVESLEGISWNPGLLQPQVPPEILLERLQGQALADCAPKLQPAPGGAVHLTAGPPLTMQSLPETSLVDAASQDHRQTPEPDPCVPCISSDLNPGGGPGQGGGYPRILGGNRAGSATGAVGRGPARDLVVDVSGATLTLEDLSYELEALYLRVGELFYPLSTVSGDWTGIERAEAGALIIEEMGHLAESSVQPSLVYVLRNRAGGEGQTSGDPATAEPYWTASPILLSRPHGDLPRRAPLH